MTGPGTIRRIGYACKTMFPDDINNTSWHNFKSTTLSYLQRLDTESRHLKLWGIIRHNMQAICAVLRYLSMLPIERRMFRIGSDLLPMWDHEIALTTYSTPEVRTYVVNNLNVIGSLARHWNIRLSFHPDQFVVIASPNPEVATRGIATLESVAEITRLMGYTGWHPDGFAINIHAGAASVTTEQLRDAITNRLSEQARNLLTLENDEFSHNLYDLCQLKDVVAIVPDLHHEWINEGWYTGAGSNCMRDVLESWRGVRPKLHLAMSREHLIPDEVKNDQLLDLHDLVFRNGLTKSKLRAHSDSPWHTPTLDYARHFHEHFDIMWEGKDKNLGQEIIYNHYNNRNEND